jgi:hypothetical protein
MNTQAIVSLDTVRLKQKSHCSNLLPQGNCIVIENVCFSTTNFIGKLGYMGMTHGQTHFVIVLARCVLIDGDASGQCTTGNYH